MSLASILYALLVTTPVSAPATYDDVFAREARSTAFSCQSDHEGSLSDGVVTIKPGEIICVVLQAQGDSVIPVKVVSKADPENTLIIKLWQEPGTNDIYLELHNPLNAFLQYKAYLLRPGQSEYEYTSSCPVLSRRQSIEQWPYALSEVTLSNFKSLPESAKLQCQ